MKNNITKATTIPSVPGNEIDLEIHGKIICVISKSIPAEVKIELQPITNILMMSFSFFIENPSISKFLFYFITIPSIVQIKWAH